MLWALPCTRCAAPGKLASRSLAGVLAASDSRRPRHRAITFLTALHGISSAFASPAARSCAIFNACGSPRSHFTRLALSLCAVATGLGRGCSAWRARFRGGTVVHLTRVSAPWRRYGRRRRGVSLLSLLPPMSVGAARRACFVLAGLFNPARVAASNRGPRVSPRCSPRGHAGAGLP